MSKLSTPKIVAIALVVILASVAIGFAATTYYVRSDPDTDLEGSPLPNVSISPSPSASPTPTPDPITVIGGALTGNDTSDGTYIFHAKDILHVIVALNVTQENVLVRLYNNASGTPVNVANATTNAAGIATFDRNCSNPYHFYAMIENTQP